MTHTLHRSGAAEELREDYVILILPARGVNHKGSGEILRQIWEVVSRYETDLTNFGNGKWNSYRTSMEKLVKTESPIVHLVFKDRETLRACLKDLKDHDFGISVVVSGLLDEVEGACAEIGLAPHTVEYSLGIHGNTARLPDENILDITTMCGHAMVSPNLIIDLVKQINEGKTTYKQASNELSRMCDCGVFNPYRAEKILRKISSTA